MCNSCTSVFPNTCALEQQEWNKKVTEEEGKKRGVSMEKSKAGSKENEIHTAYHYN